MSDSLHIALRKNRDRLYRSCHSINYFILKIPPGIKIVTIPSLIQPFGNAKPNTASRKITRKSYPSYRKSLITIKPTPGKCHCHLSSLELQIYSQQVTPAFLQGGECAILLKYVGMWFGLAKSRTEI